MSTAPRHLRYVSANRRVREDRRFVAGMGQFAADVKAANMLHVALVPSPHPAARIVAIDAKAALALPGVHYVLTGDELAGAIDQLMSGLETPEVRRYPLAVKQARYVGEWVAAVVADTRAIAEDAAELVEVTYEPLPFVIDPEEALKPDAPMVHPPHGSNVLLDRTFVWGDVEGDFAQSPQHLSFRVVWGRSSTVPVETFGITAAWDPWRELLDVWASIQMPKYADQIARALRLPANAVRVHQDIDVGGSYGVKRGIKHTVLCGYLSRRLGRPVRLIEDRLENMRAGDAHGPDRIFDVSLAFNNDGIIRSMKMRALDNVGAYAGRAPFQLGKPIGAIVGPYKIQSVEYRAQSVTTNKAVQEAVRGFGQSPTNYAIETRDRQSRGGAEPRPHRGAAAQLHPQGGVSLSHSERHALRQRRLSHRGRQGARPCRLRRAAGRARQAAPKRTAWPASASPPASSRAAAIRPSSRCSIRRTPPRPGWNPAASMSMRSATSSPPSTPRRRDRATRRWSRPWSARFWKSIRTSIRVVRPDSLESMPSNSPVGSRMAIMLGGAAFHAAQKLKQKLIAIAAHQFGVGEDAVVYANGGVATAKGDRRLSWLDLVTIAHRNWHLLPPASSRGSKPMHVYQVPTGGTLPTPDGRVQMYPCHSFEFHRRAAGHRSRSRHAEDQALCHRS